MLFGCLSRPKEKAPPRLIEGHYIYRKLLLPILSLTRLEGKA
jgi:hypothetical protein